MSYAIKSYFTEPAEAMIRSIWSDLAASGLSDFMERSGSRPGVTLGVWENAEEIDLLNLLRNFAKTDLKLPTVSTFGLGTFPTDPAHVFLGVVPSIDLLIYHTKFHSLDFNLSAICSRYYIPGSWVPHSTLALRCPPTDIIQIMEVCLKHETRLKTEIRSIGLIETDTAREIAEISYS